MKYARLGKTGLRVSPVCLGAMTYGSPKWRSWVLDEEASRPFIKKALELGINFFDTANAYSQGVSEEVLGRALNDFAARDEVVIATKVFMPMGDKPNQVGLSRKHILDAVDASLTRLGTDYIDLYQIHRWHYGTPIEETLEALNDIVRAGKVRYIGASSMHAWQFSKALYTSEIHGWAKFVSMQNFYNLMYREEEREMLPLCLDQGVGVIPWSPMARGFLVRAPGQQGETARSKDEETNTIFAIGNNPADNEIREAVARVAERKGVARAQIALAWLHAQKAVTSPIIGASKEGHLEDAIASLDVKLDEADLKELETPYLPQSIIGHR
jgi:aryl-alcohol dehydrogenase-like predicted oxidoreductase